MRATRIILLCLTIFCSGRAWASSIILPDQAKMIEGAAVIAAVDSMSYTAGAFLLRSLFALPYITEALLHDGDSN